MEARKSERTDFPSDQLDLLRVLGYHLLQNGNPVRAAQIFEALQVLCPDDPNISLSLACALLRSKQVEQATQVLGSIPGSQADSALAWLLRGQALTQTGRMAEAARAMRLFIHRRATEKHKGAD